MGSPSGIRILRPGRTGPFREVLARDSGWALEAGRSAGPATAPPTPPGGPPRGRPNASPKPVRPPPCTPSPDPLGVSTRQVDQGFGGLLVSSGAVGNNVVLD